MNRKEVKTEKAALAAIEEGRPISVVGMMDLKLEAVPDADIIIIADAYLNLTLHNSQSTVQARDRSQARVETWDSSQSTVQARDRSQVSVETRDNSQATVETSENSQATVKAWSSSQVSVQTWDSKSPLPKEITEIGGYVVAPNRNPLLAKVAATVCADPEKLDMGDWHCGTSHCIAGWAEVLADEKPKNQPPHSMGLILLGREAAEHFYDNGADALAWLQSIDREMNGAMQ